MAFRIELDGEYWCDMDTLDEAVDYAGWLVEMPWHAPEAKGDSVRVIDTDTGIVEFTGDRTDFSPAEPSCDAP